MPKYVPHKINLEVAKVIDKIVYTHFFTYNVVYAGSYYNTVW